jgi:hypothetical protein
LFNGGGHRSIQGECATGVRNHGLADLRCQDLYDWRSSPAGVGVLFFIMIEINDMAPVLHAVSNYLRVLRLERRQIARPSGRLRDAAAIARKAIGARATLPRQRAVTTQ